MKISDYQKRIDLHVKKLGGYWKSISALARLNEEVGELAELLLENPVDYNEVGSELADIFVISSCISNQYLNSLDEEYEQKGYSPEVKALVNNEENSNIEKLFFDLVVTTGRISRIINHYEGDKVKKTNEIEMRLGSEVADLQISTIKIANAINKSIFQKIDDVLEKSAIRDKGRFNILHDPTTEGSLDRFKAVIKNTRCSFANKAKVWGSYEWDESKNFSTNLNNTLPSLKRFSESANAEGLDGYVIEIRDSNYGNNLDSLSICLNKTLKYLSDNDPKEKYVMNQKITNDDWQFSYNGVRFFVTTFASFYPVNHPRYSPIDGSLFIFLQPEFSFDHNGIHGNNPKREKIKEGVRNNFKKTEGYYDVDLIKQPKEAYKYIKPISEKDPVVHWWE